MKLINIFFRTLKDCNVKNYKIFKELLSHNFIDHFLSENEATCDNIMFLFLRRGQNYFQNNKLSLNAHYFEDTMMYVRERFTHNILETISEDIFNFFEKNNITEDIIKYARINVENAQTKTVKKYYVKKWIINHYSISSILTSAFIFSHTEQGAEFWLNKSENLKLLILKKLLI